MVTESEIIIFYIWVYRYHFLVNVIKIRWKYPFLRITVTVKFKLMSTQTSILYFYSAVRYGLSKIDKKRNEYYVANDEFIMHNLRARSDWTT